MGKVLDSPLFIRLNSDAEDAKDKKRLSWSLDGAYGGWRIGDVIGLYLSSEWKKIILIKL